MGKGGRGVVVLLGARAGSVCLDMEEWKGTQFDFVLTHGGKRMSISGLFFLALATWNLAA